MKRISEMSLKERKAVAKTARLVEVTLHLRVPAALSAEDIDARLMDIIDQHDPSRGGDGFWVDSRCDSVRDV